MGDALTFVGPRAVQSRIAIAWLAQSTIEPRLGAITLAAHQVDAAARLLQIVAEFGGALLADEVGMGKTYAALAVARCFDSLCVVTPAALRGMWLDALAMAGRAAPVLSFETLSRRPAGPGSRGAIVVIDEAHHARNHRTRRYDALARLTIGSRVLLLSATPVHNRPSDLRSLLALFLGARAGSLGADDLSRLIVRRGRAALSDDARLPELGEARWLGLPPAPDVLQAILALPPPVPPADGGLATALLRLGLVRAWTSSDAALRSALRRRVHRAAALCQALESDRYPTRRELAAWTLVEDAMQLAFPQLVSGDAGALHARHLLEALDAHRDGARLVLRTLDQRPSSDAVRVVHLRRLREQHREARIVAFTQFAETARAMFDALRNDSGVALVTSRGARIASGRVSRHEIIERFGADTPPLADRRFPLGLLISTDVLSEGLNLQGASVLVHLDLPWTMARLEQRLGRIRRLGGTHQRVFAYAIGPPVHAQQLLTSIRALQRKARMMRTLIGESELVGHEPLLGQRLYRATRAADQGLAASMEALRRIFQTWSRDTDRSEAGGRRSELHGPSENRAPSCAVVISQSLDAPWRAVALVEVQGKLRVLALTPEGASGHPRDLLGTVRHTTRSREMDCAAGGRARARLDLRAALATAQRWLAEQRGGALIAPAIDTPSAAHAAVLRRIAELASSAPRHERAVVSELAARCRALVLSARGAGAERVIADWVQGVRDDGAPVGAPAPFHDLIAVLQRGHVVPGADSHLGDASLLALLVVSRA